MKTAEIYQHVTDRIIALLESAKLPKFEKPWIYTNQGSPYNSFSNTYYRGINPLLLTLDCIEKGFNLNRWMSFKQAKELGGTVKKGEKSSIVVLYQKSFFDKDGKKIKPEALQEMSTAERMSIEQKSFLTAYNIFNVAQIEGLPEKHYLVCDVTKSDFEKHEQAESILEQSGARIVYGGNDACYLPAKDMICLPVHESFTNEEGFYNVAFHELIHWTGSAERLNREQSKRIDRAYMLEELVAELGSAFVSNAVGIEKNITNQAAYLDSWIKGLQADKTIIFTIATAAQKAADMLLNPLLSKEQKTA